MSRPTERSRDGRHGAYAPEWLPSVDAVTSWVRTAPGSSATVGLAGPLLALVATMLALRVANNAPGPMSAPLAAAHAWLGILAPTTVALLVVLLGAAHRGPWVRAGLAFAGVFGLLGLHVPAVALPAVVAVGGGAALTVVGRVVDEGPGARHAVAAVVWLGLVLALASATGLADAGLRPVASTVSLAGVALLPVALAPTRGVWVAGGLAAAAVLWLGSTLPFVTGAVVLVGYAVVGAPLVVVAAAAGGGLAGLGGALARRRWQSTLAAGLLVAAGVPATLPRALAAAAGLALLVGGERA